MLASNWSFRWRGRQVSVLPYLLILPTLAFVLLFTIYPTFQVLRSSQVYYHPSRPDRSRMTDLTTEIAPLGGGFAEDLWAQATEITPVGAGDIGDLYALVSIEPEATVGYRVIPNVVFHWEGVRTYVVRVSSAEGGELGSGRIVWHRRNCPYIG